MTIHDLAIIVKKCLCVAFFPLTVVFFVQVLSTIVLGLLITFVVLGAVLILSILTIIIVFLIIYCKRNCKRVEEFTLSSQYERYVGDDPPSYFTTERQQSRRGGGGRGGG